MAGLPSLPDELLEAIVELCDQSKDLTSLIQVNRRLSHFVSPILYEAAVAADGGLAAMDHALKLGSVRVVKMCLDAGASPDLVITSNTTMECYYQQSLAVGLQRIPCDTRAVLFPGLIRQLGSDTTPNSAQTQSHQSKHPDFEDFPDSHFPGHPFSSLVDAGPKPPDELPFHSFFWTPLHVAAARGDRQLLELLLENGANPKPSGTGLCGCDQAWCALLIPLFPTQERIPSDDIAVWSPLHVAVCKKQYDCAQRLIELGGAAHLTPEHGDEGSNHAGSETSFLSISLSPVVKRLDPWSLFHTAAFYDDDHDRVDRIYKMLEQASLLCPAGVDVPDLHGNRALAVASYSGHFHPLGVWFVFKGAELNAKIRTRRNEISLLNFLCFLGKYADASLAMDMGADIDSHEGGFHDHWDSLLHLCCFLHHKTVKSIHAASAQTLATEQAAKKMVAKLLARGLDVDATAPITDPDPWNEAEDGMQDIRTPLMYAAMRNSLSVVTTLLSANARVDEEDFRGCTALHLVCAEVESLTTPRQTPVSMVRLLVASGANVNHYSQEGQTVVFNLFDYRFSGAGMEPPSDILSRPRGSRLYARAVMVRLLQDLGADLNLRDKDRGSLLQYAFQRRDYAGVDLLLELGITVSQADYLQMLERSCTLYMGVPRWLCSPVNAVKCLFTLPSKQLDNVLETPQFQSIIRTHLDEAFAQAASSCAYDVLHYLLDRGIFNSRGHSEQDEDYGDNFLHVVARKFLKVRATGTRSQGLTLSTSPPEQQLSDMELDSRIRLVARVARGPGYNLLNEVNNAESSPLTVALEKRNVDVALVLIQCGADVHTRQPPWSNTPFMSILLNAVRDGSSGFWNVALSMLDLPRSPLYNDNAKLCLLELVRDVSELLYSSSSYLNSDGSWHVRHDERSDGMAARMITLAMRLLEFVDVNQVDVFGNTALWLLLYLALQDRDKPGEPCRVPKYSLPLLSDERQHNECVSAILGLFMLFVSKGADLNIKNWEEETPLDMLRQILAYVAQKKDKDYSRKRQSLTMAFRKYVRLPPFTSPLASSIVAREGCDSEPLLLVYADMQFPLELVSREELMDPRRWRCIR